MPVLDSLTVRGKLAFGSVLLPMCALGDLVADSMRAQAEHRAQAVSTFKAS